MGDFFNPSDLTRVPFQDEVFGPLSIIYLGVFVIGFLTALVLYFRPPARIKGHPVRRRLAGRITTALMWGFGVGLAFFVFRVMGLPGLGWPLWLYLSAIAVIALAGYIVYYSRTKYPAEMAAYEEQRLKRQYQQAARRRPVSEDGVVVPRSPRAEKRRQRSTGARTR